MPGPRSEPLDVWLLVGWSAMECVALATLAIGWLQLRGRLRAAS